MRPNSLNRLFFVAVATFAIALPTSGCVKRGVHEDIVARLEADRAALEAEHAAVEARLSAELADCRAELASTASALEATQGELAACQTQLEHTLALLEESDETSAELAARLRELAAIEAELRERDAIFTDIVSAFESLIENGFVEVVIDRGRLVIKMPQDILFESGSAEIGEEGEAALIEVANVLAALNEREFQVEGHTDNVPISTRQFPSNWELSTARALAVVHLFEETGVHGANLSAAGFGEFRPRAENDTPENKEMNRRIEIVMVPNLEAIFGGIVRE